MDTRYPIEGTPHVGILGKNRIHPVEQVVAKQLRMNKGVENLKAVLSQATSHDMDEGRGAYAKYHRIVSKIAHKTNTTPRIAAAVFAALSPNNDYHGNLRDAHTLLTAARDKKTLKDFTVSTYGNNKRKAWWIANGQEPLNLIVANKTRNFFLNVSDPLDVRPVTIDGHMFNIWKAKRENLVGLRGFNSIYEKIADDVRTVASELNLIPNQVQGILWITWRRIHRIRTTSQLGFWDDDYLAARLGYEIVI